MFFSSNVDAKKTTNWFSSLRRQPKPKKTALVADKLTQKSCVDLTSSSLYDHGDKSSQSPEAVETSAPDDPLCKPAAGRSICTCEWVKVTPSPSFSSDSPESSSSLTSATTATISTTVSRSLRENKYHLLPTASSEDNLTSDSANDLKDIALSALNNTSSLRRRPKRKEQVYTSTTVTTVTKTTVVNKQKTYRVGLIFSDNGELLNSNLDLRQLLEESKQAELASSESSSTIREEVNNNSRKDSKCQREFSILDDSNFDFIDDSADLFNRNYSGNNVAVHANSASSTPKVLRKCNNCKNKSNLVYRRSVSSPHRKKVNLRGMAPNTIIVLHFFTHALRTHLIAIILMFTFFSHNSKLTMN